MEGIVFSNIQDNTQEGITEEMQCGVNRNHEDFVCIWHFPNFNRHFLFNDYIVLINKNSHEMEHEKELKCFNYEGEE